MFYLPVCFYDEKWQIVYVAKVALPGEQVAKEIIKMTTDLSEHETVQIEDNVTIRPDGEQIPNSTERQEQIVVTHAPNVERREHIIEDFGLEREQILEKVTQFIWLMTGILEGFIGLRVLLKLIAANPANPFAALVYQFTDIFLWPFLGLTVTPSSGGIVLEISSVIAMVIYWLLTWVAVKVIWLLFSSTDARSVSIYHSERR